jgi:hypothetical protein
MRKLIVAFGNFAKAAKNNQLMLYREKRAVHSEIRTKCINKTCGQNAVVLNVKPAVLQEFKNN